MKEELVTEGGLSALFESPGEQPVLKDGFQDAGEVELDAETYSPEDIDKFLSDDTEKVTIDSMSQARSPRVGLIGGSGVGRNMSAMMAAALATGLNQPSIVAPPFDESMIPDVKGMPPGAFFGMPNVMAPSRGRVGSSTSVKKQRKAKKKARKANRKK